jgi:hypothetical protein
VQMKVGMRDCCYTSCSSSRGNTGVAFLLQRGFGVHGSLCPLDRRILRSNHSCLEQTAGTDHARATPPARLADVLMYSCLLR